MIWIYIHHEMPASLQDVVPWSLIYGELARLQEKKLEGLSYAVVMDYIYDRIHHGWKESDPSRFFTRTLRFCIATKIIAGCDVLRVKIHFESVGLLDRADYYLDHLIKTLNVV